MKEIPFGPLGSCMCESKPKGVCEGLGFKEILEHGGAGVFPTLVPTLVPNTQIKMKYYEIKCRPNASPRYVHEQYLVPISLFGS